MAVTNFRSPTLAHYLDESRLYRASARTPKTASTRSCFLRPRPTLCRAGPLHGARTIQACLEDILRAVGVTHAFAEEVVQCLKLRRGKQGCGSYISHLLLFFFYPLVFRQAISEPYIARIFTRGLRGINSNFGAFEMGTFFSDCLLS